VAYGGFLLPKDPNARAYFTYKPAWIGAEAGCNVAFDLGIIFGEAIIANCPKLRWEMDPLTELQPNAARASRKMYGSGFQRPKLTGFDNPAWGKDPMYEVYTFLKIVERIEFRNKYQRRNAEIMLITYFDVSTREYHAGDPTKLYSGTGQPTDISEHDKYNTEADEMDMEDEPGDQEKRDGI